MARRNKRRTKPQAPAHSVPLPAGLTARRSVDRYTHNATQRRAFPYALEVLDLAPTHWRIVHGANVVDFWPTTGRALSIAGAHVDARRVDFDHITALLFRTPEALPPHSRTPATSHV